MFLLKKTIPCLIIKSSVIRYFCVSYSDRNSGSEDSLNDNGKIKTLIEALPKRYKVFDDQHSDIIFDDIDAIFNKKQDRKKFEVTKYEKEIRLPRGKSGVFDLDEIVNLIRKENLNDIATIKVPQKLKYCDYLVLCTATSNRHSKVLFLGFYWWFFTIKNICAEKPNFLILIADDLGYGDISLLGNDTLLTKNIDRIGHQGVTLTHHLTAASVCTPSRSAFLTGRYPIRNGMASPGKNRVFFFVASSGGLPENEITFARSLKCLNYSTALIGKWHLGKDCYKLNDNCHHPNNHGFDHFFGLPLTNLKDFGDDGESVILSYFPYFYSINTSIALIGLTFAVLIKWRISNGNFLLIFILIVFVLIPSLIVIFQKNIKTINSILYRNNQIVQQPVKLKQLTNIFVKEASDFIRNQTKQNKPFLLVMNFVKVHTAHAPSDEFQGKSLHGKFGDCVLELDHGVGQLLNLLETLGIKNDTVTYFSSDNGAHLEETDRFGNSEGGSNGIFKGGKGHGAVEGGIRVPGLIMWPSRFDANKSISAPTMQMDLFVTIHSIVGLKTPEDRIIDGRDLYSLLLGQRQTSSHDFMFHYCGTYLHAIRFVESTNKIWKAFFYLPLYKEGENKCQFVCMCYGENVVRHDPPLLFNIAQDPSEKKPIRTNSSNYQRVINLIFKALQIHEQTLSKNVTSQFSFQNSVWKPWLQPCCTFPLCVC